MSVALMLTIHEKENQSEFYLPIAGQDTFKTIWLPACLELNLIWMPLAETGFSFGINELPAVLDEFKHLKAHWQSKVETEIFERIVKERIDPAIQLLETHKAYSTADWWLG